jgi:hypothetical protein
MLTACPNVSSKKTFGFKARPMHPLRQRSRDSTMVSRKRLWRGKCISTVQAGFGEFECGEQSRHE